jgi:hypothetical protein
MATKRTSDASVTAAIIAGFEEGSPDSLARHGFKPRLIRPHPLVQNTRQRVETPDPYGRPSSSERQRLDVQVSKQMFKPALVVMDRLIKALEDEGFKVEVTEDRHGGSTYACDGRDRAQLSIRERTRRVEHVPTDKELREKGRHSWTRIPKWDDLYTGELELSPGGRVDLSSDDAIDLLVRKAVADVVELIEKARQRRETEEAERRREWERQRAIAAEKERVEAMRKAAAALREYRVLTDYIEEIRRFGRVPDDQRREGQTLEEWLAWAEVRAQSIHPLGD